MSARQTIIPVFVPHVGCPNACVFCNQRSISGAMRPITPQEVCFAIEQAAAMTREGTQRQLAFYGGSFTAIPPKRQEALLAAAQPYLQNGTIHAIRLSTRPDAIDEETLLRLRGFGVKTIELGAQSMDDRVLALCGRGHSAAQVAQAAKLVKDFGFELILQMMTGLPGDDGEASVATAHALAALAPHGVRLYPTVVVRNTPLYDMWQAGEYTEHTVEDAVTLCARIVPIFDAAGIPIIRLGLNPTEDLSAGEAAAGAYHPALGELVRSRIMLNTARTLMRDIPRDSDVVLWVGKGKTSQMIGQHRRNLETLRKEFGLSSIKVCEGSEKSDKITIKFVAK